VSAPTTPVVTVLEIATKSATPVMDSAISAETVPARLIVAVRVMNVANKDTWLESAQTDQEVELLQMSTVTDVEIKDILPVTVLKKVRGSIPYLL